MKKKRRLTFGFLAMMLFFVGAVRAQNLIPNGDFQQGNTGFNSDYTFVAYSHNCLRASGSEGKYTVGANARECNTNDSPLFDNGYHDTYDHTYGNVNGKFMIVNGFGGSQGAQKRVWYKQVSVVPNRQYDFSMWIANVSSPLSIVYPKIRVKINGVQVIEYQPASLNFSWNQKTYTWSSGTSTTAMIEIYDVCSGNSSNGDDFGIDDISFSPQAFVQTVNDAESICKSTNSNPTCVLIDELANDQYAGTIQSVQISQNPTKGTAVVQSAPDYKILYTPNVGATGSDSFKYKITLATGQTSTGTVNITINPLKERTANVTSCGPYTYQGQTYISSITQDVQFAAPSGCDSLVHLNLTIHDDPDVSSISSPSAICAGGSFQLVNPSVQDNGSPIVSQGWEIQINGNWIPLTNSNIPFAYNGCQIRYHAQNDCGESFSNTATVTVSDEPTIAAISAPSAICAGESFQLTVPSVQNNGSAITNQGWEIQINGNWVPLTNNNIPFAYNGCQIRYHAENACGVVSSNMVSVTVNDIPSVAPISAPDVICSGSFLDMETPSVTWNGNTGSGEWQVFYNNSWQTVPAQLTIAYNGCHVRYKAHNTCGDGYSNEVAIQVVAGPTIGATPNVVAICAGENLNLTAPQVTSNGLQITGQQWVVRPTQSGNDVPFNLTNVPASYDGWVISYRVTSSCGDSYSSPWRTLTVNTAPDITGTLQTPLAICAGDDLVVAPPCTESGQWEICQTQNGNYTNFSLQNVSANYDGWYLHYKVTNDCGSDVSNAVQIHVNDIPEVAAINVPDGICAGGSFNLTTPQIDNHGSIVINSGWEINVNGTWQSFANSSVPFGYNGHQIRYWAENECGRGVSEPITVSVYDQPSIMVDLVSPPAICEGESLALQTPEINWNGNVGSVAWQINVNGNWQGLNNGNIPFSYNGCMIRCRITNSCGEAVSAEVPITVFSAADVTEPEIQACGPVQWHGMTLSSTNDYSADDENENGCIVTYHVHFELSDAYETTETYTYCGSFQWPWNDSVYDHSCEVDYVIVHSDPLICDSTIHLSLTINNAPEITETLAPLPASVCAGQPIVATAPAFEYNHVDGGTPYWECATNADGPYSAINLNNNNLEYGDYYLRFTVENGCGTDHSNAITFHVNGLPQIQTSLTNLAAVCEGDPLDLPEMDVVWNHEEQGEGEWQISPTGAENTYAPFMPDMPMQTSHNGYYVRYVATTSCGRDVVGPVRITVNQNEIHYDAPDPQCDFYLWHGNTITETVYGLPFDTVSELGCRSTYYLDVVINHRTMDTTHLEITSCDDSFEWYDGPHSAPGDFYYTAENRFHCDSVLHLTLRFDTINIVSETFVACNSYVWQNNQYTESTVDSVWHYSQDEESCDSLLILNLTINYDTVGYDSWTKCPGFEWHGVTYYDNEGGPFIIYDTLQRHDCQCDSIVEIRLTIVDPDSLQLTQPIRSCKPKIIEGVYCDRDTTFVVPYQSHLYDCDSLVTIVFTLDNVDDILLDTVSCTDFWWQGQHCDHDATYEGEYQTEDGCIGKLFLNVTLNQTEYDTISRITCGPYPWHGVIYSQPGYYPYYIHSVQGCDSIVEILDLSIDDSQGSTPVQGLEHVYVASDLVSGIYHYEIDPEAVEGDCVWRLDNPDWIMIDSVGTNCTIMVNRSGTATLTAYYEGTCGEMETSMLINAGFFGVEDHAMDVKLYPNPTRGIVTVEAADIEEIRVLDMLGQILAVQRYGKENHALLNLSALKPALYMLEITTAKGKTTKQVSVNR